MSAIESEELSEVFYRVSSEPNNIDVVLAEMDGSIVQQKGDEFNSLHMQEAALLLDSASSLVESLRANSSTNENSSSVGNDEVEYLKVSVYASDTIIVLTSYDDMIFAVCTN